MKKRITFFTTLIIENSKIETYERNVSGFQLEIYEGNSISPTVKINTLLLDAERKNDFVIAGVGITEIKGLIVGNYYWFRIRDIKTDKEYSSWGDFYSERAGDNTNAVSFITKNVIEKSTAVTFRVTVDVIPEDFEQFEWKFETAVVDNLFVPTTPVAPTAPATDDVPDFITTSTDDISISFSEDKDKWRFVWVRVLDRSGNVGTDGWYYIGYGRVLAFDVLTDYDPYPPDNTAHADSVSYSNSTGRNFI